MKTPFRDHHLFQILTLYEENRGPLDLLLSRYLRDHKAIGSKDRKQIAKDLYDLARWKTWIDFHLPDASWQKRLTLLRKKQEMPDEHLAAHIRTSCPESLFELLKQQYGEEAVAIASKFNEQAPITLRVNALKGSRQELKTIWNKRWPLRDTHVAPNGLILEKRESLFSSSEFREGWFEMQDEGSQLVAEEVLIEPGEILLDFCAGAGGKALAIAPRMQNRGQLLLHDVREKALLQAKQRLRRAGATNTQFHPSTSKTLKKWKKRCDWVLVDAPCSGTGTYRRAPEMKERFCLEALKQGIGLQREIFERALSYLKPGGKITYATCSLLACENEEQMEHFLHRYPIRLTKDPFVSLPTRGGMDGFFAFTAEKVH